MNEAISNLANSSIPCSECPAGVMHHRPITYFTWLGEELITVPNFPAWVCDMCGRREYDERSVTLLAMILNPEAGKPTRRIRPTLKPGARKRNILPPPA